MKMTKRILALVSLIITIAILLTIPAFAEGFREQKVINGNILEALVYWYDNVYMEGEQQITASTTASWGGGDVDRIYAKVQIVDYYTGSLLASNERFASNAYVASTEFAFAPYGKVTIFGSAELRGPIYDYVTASGVGIGGS